MVDHRPIRNLQRLPPRMTVEQLNRMPLLLRRGAVRRITGLSVRELDVLRESGTLKATRLRREWRYYRESVRELAGLNGQKSK
jgi:hypothetical protein